MQAKRILSMILVLALTVGIMAPCGSLVHASDDLITLYDGKFEQVTEPAIGESYYLGADADGAMMYFRSGTISDTVPYSLVTTEASGSAQQVTLEDPSVLYENVKKPGAHTTGFQLIYGAARIYCMDTLKDATVDGQTNVLDTGTGNVSDTPYKNRHNFFINEEDGSIRSTYKNDHVLVVMQVPRTVSGNTTNAWRMLFVSDTELANGNVYPVMLLQEHEHTYGAETLDTAANTASRTCTTCGYTAVAYGQAQEQVTNPEIGETYYLSANVNGELMYFKHGTVSDTTPNSLVLTDSAAGAQQITLEDPSAVKESTGEGFQMTYPNPNTSSTAKTLRIHCFGTAGSENTGAAAQDTKGKTTFIVDEVNGVKVLRKTGNNKILVVKYNETKGAWRMLGVAESELSNAGVYPAMLSVAHTHDYTAGKPQGNYANHTEACWCGAVGTQTAEHSFGAATTTGKVASRACTVCDYVEYVYDQKAQVYTPTIGDTYYLAANVNGTLKYFVHGAYSQTNPNTLVTTESAESATIITIEDPSAVQESDGTGFQLSYTHPTEGKTNRIYCVGTTTKTAADATKGRNTFKMDEVNGVTVLRKHSNNTNVLVAKEITHTDGTTKSWRITGVEDTELANEGVYPVMLLQEHDHVAGNTVTKITDAGHGYGCWCGGVAKSVAHTYGNAVVGTTSASRTCTVCGHTAVVHGQAQEQITTPEIGETYYLSANVNGELMYFKHGTVSDTTPNSLVLTDSAAGAQQITLEDPSAVKESTGEGFQMTYPNPNTSSTAKTLRIHCFGTAGSENTGAAAQDTKGKTTFIVDEVNGVKVLRKTGNNKILVVKYNETKGAWRMLGVAESELGKDGVYPVMLSVAHTHTYSEEWTFNEEAGTQSKLCTACGAPGETLYGTDTKASMVTDYAIGSEYYLAANVDGVLKFFTTGTVTNTAPYSLVTTERSSVAVKVTLEDSLLTNEKFEGGFQFAYDNDGTTNRIYCMDTLTTEGNKGIMDTGINSNAPYQNRHSFCIDEVGGVKVLRKYGNDNILVVKYNETTGTYRMLGVPQTELGSEGVYPVMLMNLHEHTFGNEQFNNDEGHYTLCDCGSKDLTPHSFGTWTLDSARQTQTATCSVCNRTVTVNSPYFDTVDSEEELKNGLSQAALIDGTESYNVTGGKDYFLTAEVNGERYYFRNTGKTAGGNSETVVSTSGYSLYATKDPNHANILKTQVVAGKTENTYIIHYKTNKNLAVYMTTADGVVNTGITAYKGESTNAAYAEFMWDEATGCLYQTENKVRYVLVLTQMAASYSDGAETGTEWRIAAVPMSEANNAGNYPVKLTNHIHNCAPDYESDGTVYWRDCGCGYKATVTGSIILGENIGMNFAVKLEQGETVTATVAGKDTPVVLTQEGNGVYNAFVPVAAAQMTDEVKICVGGNALNVAFSVKSAADAILAGSDENAKALVNHMLAYGAAAQNYFDYNAQTPAGAEMDVTMPTEDIGVAVQSDLPGVEYYGTSVLHESGTAVYFYFQAESVDGLTFTADGNVVEPAAKDGMYYVAVRDINPQNLNKDLSVVVSNGEQNLEVHYSPVTYMVRTYNRADASDTLKALVKAMYGYHTAAKNYIANMYLDGTFSLKSQKVTALYEGVDQYTLTYDTAGVESEAYAIVIDAQANVELKVSAGAWSESSTAANPGETKTVREHFRGMKNSGETVLAMINGGFFDLTASETMKPYGMQIVDGVVKQAPNAGDTAHGNNWFGMTKDGKYVISDAAGYEATYKNNVQQGVGGGSLLMIDGIAQNVSSSRDYRTAVGVNAAGDLVLVAVRNATYSDVNQVFVDLNMDIVTVLNLDGGGSTAMYVPYKYYPYTKALIYGEYRKVADAVGIVVKN